MPHWVYIQLGDADRFLYVGATYNLKQRSAEHRRDTAWIGEVRRTEVFGPYSRAEARSVERILIGTLCPRYNLHHNPRNRGIATGIPFGAPNAERSAAIYAAVNARRGRVA